MPLNRPAHRARLTRALLGCGLAAGPAFVGIASVEGWRRAEYRALRHPVSSLALGERGAVQSANFLMTGVLCSAFAVGVARAGGPVRPDWTRCWSRCLRPGCSPAACFRPIRSTAIRRGHRRRPNG